MADDLAKFHSDIGAAKNAAHESGDTSAFMADAVAGMRLAVGSGLLGKAPIKAGDEAYEKFHGPGPNKT